MRKRESATVAGASEIERLQGLTVYAREVVAGDLVRDCGMLRTVVRVAADEDSSWLLHFEAVEGYPSTLRVADRNQIYVRRARRHP
jgi:hypothetical protein